MSSVPVPLRLLDFIKNGRTFLIAGHKEPDGDCVGSQLALALALGRLGKKCIPCSAGPFKRTEILKWKDRFASRVSDAEREGARVIIVDCGSSERCGDLAPFLEGLPLAVIDHHASFEGEADSPSEFEKGAVLFLDVKAPSVTLMVFSLIEALGLSPTPEEAGLLFFGLCTDTGFFRHIGPGGEETFNRAAALAAAGANPKETYHAIHSGKSLGSRNLMGIVLARAKSYYSGKLVLSWEEYEETRQYGGEGRDSDAVYQMLMSVGGVEAVAVLRQETPDLCALGLRSRDDLDVAQIARLFGGGGHKNAAGAGIPGKIGDILPGIINSFKELL
jgi:phosphoesterase RecJ-like protein